ncbi:unnamed protein product [Durusdinium trenchii]|uniref:Uncharacterized protein n=1 Tax=Durusdinium trenchii TaxID=1381693 RepID=A0ABP0MDZ0_9DINO
MDCCCPFWRFCSVFGWGSGQQEARQRTPDELLEEIFQQFEEPGTGVIQTSHLTDALAKMNLEDFEDASDDIVRQPLDLADVHFAQMDKADFEVELLKKVLNSLGHPERLTLRSFQQTMKEVLAGWCAREQVQEALRLAQVFDPKKIGVLPRPSIVKMVQLWSKSCFSEKQLEEILKDVPSNSQGLEYRYIIPSLLPLKAKYDLEDPKSLAKFLIDANIRLVRAEYLYKLLRSNRCMPRRQEAEDECCEVNGAEVSALVSHQEVADWALGHREALICSVSHAWEAREHPDPCRFQLENLVSCVGLYDAAYFDDLWIFYDYVSLFQFQRHSAEQEASFRRAMGNMHMLYAHQSTMTFRLERLTPLPLWTALKEDFTYKVLVYHVPSGAVVPVPLSFLVRNGILYRGRGWCRAEIEWSATRGIQQKNLAVDGEPGERGRMKKVPMAPAMFQRHMDTAAFTHRDDSKNVVQLQKKIFYDKVTARKQLNLMDLSEADMIELTASLLHFKELKVLRINIFSAGKAEATAFFQALKPLTLEKLVLNSAVGSGVHEAIAKGLPQINFSCMSELDLEDCRIGNLGAQALGEVLKKNDTITHLNVQSNDLGPLGIEVLAEALRHNSTLRVLSLRQNHIGDVGVQALAEALSQNRTLTEIYLNWEHQSAVGVQALQQVEERLKANRDAAQATAEAAEVFTEREARRQSREARRQSNRPGRPRLQGLARALKADGIQRKIHLSGENIGDEDLKVLCDALKLNNSVDEIDLQRNRITDAGVKALAEALCQNKRITLVNLMHNDITDGGIEAFFPPCHATAHDIMQGRFVIFHSPSFVCADLNQKQKTT